MKVWRPVVVSFFIQGALLLLVDCDGDDDSTTDGLFSSGFFGFAGDGVSASNSSMFQPVSSRNLSCG